jgi:phosphoglycerol transferase MdoB-like AlkP superfamily enzyme
MKNAYKTLLKQFIYLLVFYTICRLLFFGFNLQQYSQFSYRTILSSFALGLRFDVAIIVIINAVYVLFFLQPYTFFQSPRFQKILTYFFIITNLFFMLLNVSDSEYYKFIGRRVNFSIWGIIGDFNNQVANLSLKYWYLALIDVILIIFFVKFLPKNSSFNSTKLNLQSPDKILWTFASILMVGVCIVGFRGFREKPLRITQAFSQNNNALGNLVLNSPFTFLTTIDAHGTEKVSYYKTVTETLQPILRDTSLTGFTHEQPQNVVIIIFESLAAEYMGYGNDYQGFTPFVDSLAKVGTIMKYSFANGRESIDAVPAVTASIPKMMDVPFITSMYQSNKIIGLASLLSQSGYYTTFFHGAKNGSMGFEGFSQVVGYQQYFGLNEYPDKNDFDGNWGIFDEPFLQYFNQKLSQEKQPFFSTVFTLSSHVPYTIPEKHKGRFRKGKLEIHESLGYADFALKRFFVEASKQPWFNNTLFVITGDHTQQNSEPKYNNELGQYRVPIIFFHGNVSDNQILRGKLKIDKIIQHADIMPTILDYLNIKNQQPLPFGESMFKQSDGGWALKYNEGIFRLTGQNCFLNLNKDEEKKIEKWGDLSITPKVEQEYEQKLKAYIQYHHNGLVENSWVK